ncbi:MAG: DNA translocase FtsK 4TM domain-containing protein [Polyangia bacterium]|jgi:S-DNA-T family DNA segregation ATPase FtsK/SpoIIIE|nr:DNA translocase FtsK 4TM domain-containing protein [Polyangia bacterium]
MSEKEPDLAEEVLLKAPPPRQGKGRRKQATPPASEDEQAIPSKTGSKTPAKADSKLAGKGSSKSSPKNNSKGSSNPEPGHLAPRHSLAGEALGVALLALSLLAFTALVSLQFGAGKLMGPFGRMLALSLYALLGLGSYLVVLAVGFIGLRTLMGRGQTIRWTVWAGYLGATVAGSVLFHCMFPGHVVHGFTAGGKGGEILGELLVALFSSAGTYLVTSVAMVLCLMLATEASLVQVAVGIGRGFARLAEGLASLLGRLLGALRRIFTWQAMEASPQGNALCLSAPLEAVAKEAADLGPTDKQALPPALIGPPKENPEPADVAPEAALGDPEPAGDKACDPDLGEGPAPKSGGLRIVEPEARSKRGRRKLGSVLPVSADGFKLPPLSMLETPSIEEHSIDRDHIQNLAQRLTQALRVFRIQGEVTEVHPGPVVTLYEFRPAPGTKLSQIESLDRDLALTLKATSVRVARIRGKDTVGIEVPNKNRDPVLIQELLSDAVFAEARSLLTMGLGKDISGKPTVCDLAKAPHLLVAGSTGSGKSVGINVMLMSLLYRARPDQVRMILIDPKMLEFNIYEGIPHLLLPVVTDPKQANQALRWAVAEMDRRYQLMGESGVRSVDDYNAKVREQRALAEKVVREAPDPDTDEEAGSLESPPEPLPYIVIVIDEFADLMMVAPKDVETSVARIAQKARAAGIHLILATQRPSRDVITGLIKANFPSRMSFQVSSKTDSRVVLDRNGAEALLGMGDMLFMPGGRSPERIQGAFVSTAEVLRVVEFLKQQADPAYNLDILQPEEEDGELGYDESEKDDLYDRALFIVTQSRKASTSWVQRQLRIGYNRAARILEIMEREGVVGPQLPGAKTRDVLAPPPPEP